MRKLTLRRKEPRIVMFNFCLLARSGLTCKCVVVSQLNLELVRYASFFWIRIPVDSGPVSPLRVTVRVAAEVFSLLISELPSKSIYYWVYERRFIT